MLISNESASADGKRVATSERWKPPHSCGGKKRILTTRALALAGAEAHSFKERVIPSDKSEGFHPRAKSQEPNAVISHHRFGSALSSSAISAHSIRR